jgi:hypothetical protein
MKRTQGKERGALITIWLTLMFIANAVTAIVYIFFNSQISKLIPMYYPMLLYLFGVIAFVNVFLVLFMFNWKRWAFWTFVGTTSITFIINASAGIGIITSLLGFISPILLYLIIRSRWTDFD